MKMARTGSSVFIMKLKVKVWAIKVFIWSTNFKGLDKFIAIEVLIEKYFCTG